MPLGPMVGVAVTEYRAVGSAGSKILSDTNWDVVSEDLPARNGCWQLLEYKCSWLHFLLNSLYFGMLMVLSRLMPSASSLL